MRTLHACGKYILAGAATLAALASLDPAHAGVRVLHTFDLSDGDDPDGVLVEDTAGNLYGTTVGGGSGGCYKGCGTVFKLAPDGTESVLYSFGSRGNDGSEPDGLIMDEAGNLYGTTAYGGSAGCDDIGCGTVFEVAPDGTETVLYAFPGGAGGTFPVAGVIRDKAGNLYGTTAEGGTVNTNCQGSGCGTVFKLAPNGTETVLYTFAGGSDGDTPQAGLIEDSAGNLYGTTYEGGTGCTYFGCGTVFKIAPGGTKTTLYSFKGGTDGATPYSGLIAGSSGNFYGETSEGGGTGCSGYGCGTVFELAADGTETVLHAFAGGSDGAGPGAGLIKDKAGNLYGTTGGGGSGNCGIGEDLGCGTIFEVAPDGTETVLHAFQNVRSHGYDPGGLIKDKDAHLVGTTFNGGIRSCFGWPGRSGSAPAYHPRGCGIVFRLERHRLQS
jgi:uncharacterized repeat protein (TIGR03803 family)